MGNNILDMRREERRLKIFGIIGMLRKAFKAGRNVDKKKLIGVCMADMGISWRVAVEYIKSAMVLENLIEDKGIIKKAKKGSQKTIFADE